MYISKQSKISLLRHAIHPSQTKERKPHLLVCKYWHLRSVPRQVAGKDTIPNKLVVSLIALLIVVYNTHNTPLVIPLLSLPQDTPRFPQLRAERLPCAKVRRNVPDLQLGLGARRRKGEGVVWREDRREHFADAKVSRSDKTDATLPAVVVNDIPHLDELVVPASRYAAPDMRVDVKCRRCAVMR
ncbi:hypothetical protein B0H16DRAFT_1598824 [Mycena metata]|uniref:Uncharacterized protein n=1 Tax=Mycena metata TaxID=1033252 RepID=A0AAD7HLE0_9AGAR|nr:hypothetical protein B0H16DRAFT_1598824 [Mycena metata]